MDVEVDRVFLPVIMKYGFVCCVYVCMLGGVDCLCGIVCARKMQMLMSRREESACEKRESGERKGKRGQQRRSLYKREREREKMDTSNEKEEKRPRGNKGKGILIRA